MLTPGQMSNTPGTPGQVQHTPILETTPMKSFITCVEKLTTKYCRNELSKQQHAHDINKVITKQINNKTNKELTKSFTLVQFFVMDKHPCTSYAITNTANSERTAVVSSTHTILNQQPINASSASVRHHNNQQTNVITQPVAHYHKPD